MGGDPRLARPPLALSPLQPRLQERAEDESETFLVRGSESAEVRRIVDARFQYGGGTAATIAYFRDEGLRAEDLRRAAADGDEICDSVAIPSLTLVSTPLVMPCGQIAPGQELGPTGGPLRFSEDGAVALGGVLFTDDSTSAVVDAVTAIREVVPPPRGDGLQAYVTGEAGYDADRSEAVEGIDETLLLVTVSVLVALLLAIYRSPLVALVPLAVVVLAYLIAAGITYALVSAGVTTISGQTTAILIVLMFGAGTDYCLLLVARFRDELRRTADAGEAMAAATVRTAPAIVSAGAIVIVAMLVLALADFNATREMGPILALGIAIMVLAGLTLLPATLAALGRRSFWPSVPDLTGERVPAAALWRRAAGFVGARPLPVAAAVTAALLAGALGNLGGRETLDFSESFRHPPESVRGQELIRERFIPGRAAPLDLVADFGASGDVVVALGEEELVERAGWVAGSAEPEGRRPGWRWDQLTLPSTPSATEPPTPFPACGRPRGGQRATSSS